MRRFIVAPSMARLIRRERGSARLVEGYFPTQSSRNSHVRIEGAEGQLILITPGDNGQPVEEITIVPRKPAEALLDVCAGRLDIERTSVAVAGRELQIERIAGAGRTIDVATVEAGPDFVPPPWIGREVGGEGAFWNRAFALEGIPAVDVPVSDAALNALIDTLDNRFGAMFEPTRQAEVRQPEPRQAEPRTAEARQPEPAKDQAREAARAAAVAQPEVQPRRAGASARSEPPVHVQANSPGNGVQRETASAQRPGDGQAQPAAQHPAGPPPAAQQPATANAAAQESAPSKRMETIIQGLSKVLREPGLPAEGEAIVELDRWGGRRR